MIKILIKNASCHGRLPVDSTLVKRTDLAAVDGTRHKASSSTVVHQLGSSSDALILLKHCSTAEHVFLCIAVGAGNLEP